MRFSHSFSILISIKSNENEGDLKNKICGGYADNKLSWKYIIIKICEKIAYLSHMKRTGLLSSKAGLVFGHARRYPMPNGVTLLSSYHPSNQNTATGKLTSAMFEDVFRLAKKIVGDPSKRSFGRP